MEVYKGIRCQGVVSEGVSISISIVRRMNVVMTTLERDWKLWHFGLCLSLVALCLFGTVWCSAIIVHNAS